MIYVKNNQPMKVLQNILSPYKAYTYELPYLSHFQILGLTVYVFLHKEKRTLKSEKWSPRALKSTLVGYNGHTIYCVHFKDQGTVIWIKTLWIIEDYKNKLSTKLFGYGKGTLIFQSFFFANDNNEQLEVDLDLTSIGQKNIDVKLNQLLPSYNKSQKVIEAETILLEVILPTRDRKIVDDELRKSAMNISRSQKVIDTKSCTTDAINTSKGQKIIDAESHTMIAIKKSYIDQIIKFSTKAKDTIKTSWEQQNSEIENLIIQLTNFLEA